jgi:GH15 family glucan-1,4-alpha-glucosidase
MSVSGSRAPDLDLGVIGNCALNALIDGMGRIVWCCLPRPDGDPVFHALLGSDVGAARGCFAVEVEDTASVEQHYVANTAILETNVYDRAGNGVRITDFAPRFTDHGRTFRPLMLVRRVAPVAGHARIRVRVAPGFAYGESPPVITRGSNHIRYAHSSQTLRLTCDLPVTYILDETVHQLDRPVHMLFGVDETIDADIVETVREFEERTADYWKHWARVLAVPLEWQDQVIRAAITLKLCTFEETGAILAAMTSSIPEAPGAERNWDYRYCWLRDAFFVVRALNGLSEVATMENYLRYLANVGRTAAREGHLQPVYGIGLEPVLDERTVPSLRGYRGIGPVRVGNQAYRHHQHDVYGHAVLAATQAFFDRRLLRQGRVDDFHAMEWLGDRAYELHDKPDAGIWELRTRSDVHTSSSAMCWAACDRLGKIATRLGLPERAEVWKQRANGIRTLILERSWSERRRAFVDTFGGGNLDASVLLMNEVGLIGSDDPRWRDTLVAVRDELRRGNRVHRYVAPDDFGVPTMAFTACTFWFIDALARAGGVGEARELFEDLLGKCNRLGLLSEHIDATTGELWGNFPQTYSMAGIINGATRLSRKWESVL